MFSTVGARFLLLVAQVTAWLTSTFIGTAYLFIIVMLVFAVILTLGGKNE